MKSYIALLMVVLIAVVALATDSRIQAFVAVNYTPVATNTTNNMNASEVNITTITITSYTTTTVTSYIFQTYTSIQVVTLNWGVDPNHVIIFIVVAGTLALIIGYILGYRTKREEIAAKSRIEKPTVKPGKRR
ncbi:MAG: hypothetical protein QXJ56_04925 [Ignisphaera sp.]|uniref:Uncharacterized protein n=1 Tax=Ignisphaera aggregans TaxID=334771 RepID=A0A7J3JNQ1_9CREN